MLWCVGVRLLILLQCNKIICLCCVHVEYPGVCYILDVTLISAPIRNSLIIFLSSHVVLKHHTSYFFSLFLILEQEVSQIPPAEARPSWRGQAELSCKPACLQARNLKGQRPFPLSCLCFPSFSLLSLFLTENSGCETVLTHLWFLLANLPLSHMEVVRLAPCVGRRGVGWGFREKEVL